MIDFRGSNASLRITIKLLYSCFCCFNFLCGYSFGVESLLEKNMKWFETVGLTDMDLIENHLMTGLAGSLAIFTVTLSGIRSRFLKSCISRSNQFKIII